MVFTDCESRTRSISTNPGSTEAGEYGLTRGTCFVERRIEVVAVGGLLWISWSVFAWGGFFRVFFFDLFFSFERSRPAASMRLPCLIYLSTSDSIRISIRFSQSWLYQATIEQYIANVTALFLCFGAGH